MSVSFTGTSDMLSRWIADLRENVTVAMVRSLSMVGRVPVKVFQLASSFIP